MAYFEQRGVEPEQKRALEQFLRSDTGDDFAMINVIDMYEKPQQIPGVEPGESSDDVLNKYMQYMYPALFARASHPVFVGDAAASALDLMNAPEMRMDRSALMRYRSRRDMMEITINPAFSGPMTSK